MDPVSNGASVLAFITIAIQSAQTLYEAFSAVKDGPRNVQQAAYDVRQLQRQLEQLQRCRTWDNEAGEAGKEHVERCSRDLEGFAVSLGKLKISGRERLGGKIWKRVKMAFNEDDLTKMSRIVGAHTSALNLQLSTLQSDVVYESRDQIVSFGNQLSQQAGAESVRYNLLQQQNVTLTSMGSDLGQVKQDCSSIQQMISTMSSGSSSQMDQMVQLLRQLQTTVGGLSRPAESPGISSHDPSTSCPSARNDKGEKGQDVDGGLSRSIDQLCEIVHEKECTTRTDEADDIIEALQELLAGLKTKALAQDETPDRKALVRDCRTFEGLVLGAGRIALNQPARRPRLSQPRGPTIDSSSRKREFDIGPGVLTISSSIRRRQKMQDSETETTDSTEEFTATISFLAKYPGRNKMFRISVRRDQLLDRLSSDIPRLSVNNILPIGSRVFRVIERGDLEGLQRMLMDGEASLRDHDEYGATLLFYARRRPEMCRFLLENGVDVNVRAPSDGYGSREPYRPGRIPTTALHVNVGKGLGWECQKLLIQAGADPLIPAHFSYWSSLETACEGLQIRRLRLFLGAEYQAVHIEERVRKGYTPLLLVCSSMSCFSFERGKSCLAFLLQQGADTHATDDKGYGCLHRSLKTWSKAIPRTYWREREVDPDKALRDVLVLLIQHGADVHLRAADGESVFQAACQATCGDYYGCQCNVMMIWHEALQTCGYDLVEYYEKVKAYTPNWAECWAELRKHYDVIFPSP